MRLTERQWQIKLKQVEEIPTFFCTEIKKKKKKKSRKAGKKRGNKPGI